MLRSKLTRAFTLATVAFAALFTATAQAGTPPLPNYQLKTKAQRQAMVVPSGTTVIEQETGFQFRGNSQTVGGIGYGLTSQRLLLEKMRRLASAARSNNVIDNGVMASPPTLTTAAGYTQTKSYFMGTSGALTNQDKIIVVGGVPFVNESGSYLAVKSVSSTTGSNIGPTGYYQHGWYVEFMTDAPVFSFSYLRTVESGCMVAVAENGGPMQYVSMTPFTLFGAANAKNTGAVTVTFAASKIRRIRLEFGSQQVDEQYVGGPIVNLRAINVDPGYSIWKPKDVDVINAAIVGDSYTVGAPRDTGMQSVNWARTLGAKLGWRINCLAQGGTGYSKANGALPAAADPLRLADLTAQAFAYDVFVFALGTNDVNGNDGTATALPDIQAKALTCFQAARAANAIAPIIVVGPWPRTSFPPQTQQDCATAVEAAFAQFNDPNSLYIPIYDDPSGNWMAGTSYQGQLNNSNDISYRYIWTDKIHPVLAGHYYYGDRVAQWIRDWLQTLSLSMRLPAPRRDEGLVFRMPDRPAAIVPARYSKAA